MKHPWMRLLDMANVIGLLCGALGLIVAGQQIGNSTLINSGATAFILFMLIFIVTMALLIRDLFHFQKEVVQGKSRWF